MKKSTKYILILMASILLLLCALLLFIQSVYFKEKVKIKLINVIEAQLNVSVKIEAIETNWYRSFVMRNVKLIANDSIAASVEMLQIDYHLLPLFRKHVEIDSLVINEPHIRLWQNRDSVWNWSTIILQTDKSQENRKRNIGLGFKVDLNKFHIKNGGITIASTSAVIPERIRGLNLLANAVYTKKEQQFELEHLLFSTQNPSIELKNFSGLCTINKSGIQIDSLRLITGHSHLDSNGKLVSVENNNVNIDARQIDNKELSLLIPQLKLLCSPALKASLTTTDNAFSAQLQLEYKKEKIEIELALNELSNLISKTGKVPYLSTIQLHNFNISSWIETNEQFNFPDGLIELNGANLLNIKERTNVEAHFTKASFQEFVADTLHVKAIYLQDSISADVDVFSEFGNLNIKGGLANIFEVPEYKTTIVCENIAVHKLVPELLGTFVNGRIVAEGSGLKSDNFLANAAIMLKNSTVYMIPVDSLYSSLTINTAELLIDSLQIMAPGVLLHGNGNLDFDSLYLKSVVYGTAKSIHSIDSIVELPILFDSLTTTTTINGPVQFLNIGGNVEVYNATGYWSEVERADASYLVEILEDSLNVHVNTSARNTVTAGLAWDSTTIDLNYTDSQVDIIANLNWLDTLQTIFETRIDIGDTMAVLVPNLEVNSLFSSFFLPDTMRARVYNYEKIEIENLSIKDANNPDFTLDANGTIANNEAINFLVLVKQFKLDKLNPFLSEQDSVKGIFETQITFSGEPQNPVINGELAISNPKIREYALSSVQSNFKYENREGFVELTTKEHGESLYASLSANFDAYVDSLKLVFNPPETFSGSIVVDSLDASKSLAAFVPNDSIKGILNGQIDAKGEWDKPLLFGSVNVSNGQYINHDLGLEYNDIETALVFDGKTVKLDTVIIRQKNGLIAISGEVEFDSTMISGNVKSSSLQVDANEFYLAQHRNYEIVIDANTFIKTSDNKPEYGGKIKVLRSDVYLPAFISDNKSDVDNDVPMLVEAIQETADSTVLAVLKEEVITKSEKIQSRFSKQLTGRLNVEIPRNTWVRSDDMRAELSGELEIVKTGPYFEIFGNIDVTRGQYILYGRKLDIQESQVVFQGGQELNPVLNIKAEYIFRGSDKEKRYLQLLVNGEMSEPDITFLLDDTEITETDGISILIFGVTSDEITYGGQNSLLNSMGSNAVASVITSQLSRTIGTQLKLDMIEITATENWQSAAFVVGKYITNDIFVIYQRGFGEVDGDEITPENITIEYELNDKLFLRLMSGSSKESGADIILKFEEGDKLQRKKKKE